jgi:beta-carotene hydroxylase
MLASSQLIRKLRTLFCVILPLRYYEDIRSIFFLVLLSILFFVQWTGMLQHWTLFLMSCVFAFIACVIKHNHIHKGVFTNRYWNRALEYFLGFCTGQSTTSIIPVHNERHHAQNHSDQDFVRSTVVNFNINWMNLAVFFFVVVRLVHLNKSTDISIWRRKKPRLYLRIQRERLIVLAFGGTLLFLDWKATLIYLCVPWIFAQWCIVSINLLQHQDCDHHSEYNHSRNITGSLSNWLFLNSGFHAAHHLRPTMHWSRLPRFHQDFVEPHMRPELNHRSLLLCVGKQLFFRSKVMKS